MTDREKLRELIGKVQDEGVSYVDCFSDDDKPEYIGNYELADYLAEHGVTFATDTNVVGKWIPVTERLPEANESVLILEGRSVDTSFYNEELDGWGYGHDNPSHWMPLPPMPWEG